mmetsp:Transcript_20703/g.42249  ORF Transcript_20703/g.42249 Transcript_20703/m.42249 type:complete len:393 (+) Transcript_20703:127-1305(+)
MLRYRSLVGLALPVAAFSLSSSCATSGFLCPARIASRTRRKCHPAAEASSPPPSSSALQASVFTSFSKRGSKKKSRLGGREREKELVTKPIYDNAVQKYFFAILVKLVALLTRFIMCVLNKTVLHDDKKQLSTLILNRPTDTGLLTVSNHVSMADDPGIWCGILPFKALGPTFGRSIVMVEEFYYCLGSFSAAIFQRLKCLPVRRGDLRGLESPQLEALHARLNGRVKLQKNRRDDENSRRQWCHLMAEGRILQPWRFDPYDRPRLGRLRHGAAKLIACSPPSKTIVLPIYHDGMHQILPETPPSNVTFRSESGAVPENKSGRTERWVPQIGKRVDVFVGDPVDFADLVPANGLPFGAKVDETLIHAISDRLRLALLELEKRAADNRRQVGQ